MSALSLLLLSLLLINMDSIRCLDNTGTSSLAQEVDEMRRELGVLKEKVQRLEGEGGGGGERRVADNIGTLGDKLNDGLKALGYIITANGNGSQRSPCVPDDSPPTAYFTAHIRSTSNPSHGEAVLFDDVQADSANAYDVTTRTYVIPHTGVYWVSVIVDALDNLNRATLELYVNNVLLGSADAADVSEGVFTGAFRLERGQNLIVRRGHDSYNSGNTLYSRTLLSLALVQAL